MKNLLLLIALSVVFIGCGKDSEIIYRDYETVKKILLKETYITCKSEDNARNICFVNLPFGATIYQVDVTTSYDKVLCEIDVNAYFDDTSITVVDNCKGRFRVYYKI